MSSLELHSSHAPKDELYKRKERAVESLRVWMENERNKEILQVPTFVINDAKKATSSKYGVRFDSAEYKLCKAVDFRRKVRDSKTKFGVPSDSKEYIRLWQRERREKLKKEGKKVT